LKGLSAPFWMATKMQGCDGSVFRASWFLGAEQAASRTKRMGSKYFILDLIRVVTCCSLSFGWQGILEFVCVIPLEMGL